MVTVSGESEEGKKDFTRSGETALHAQTICLDPLNSSNFYVGTTTSIHHYTAESVFPIAGGAARGFEDGIGGAAKFHSLIGLLCPSNGDRMYVADCFNHRIRQIDLKTKSVTTIAGDGTGDTSTGTGVTLYHPRRIVFDRSRSVTPESIVFITAATCLHRLDLATKQLTTCKWSGDHFNPCGIDMTPSGHLIVTCLTAHSIYLYDPTTSTQELLAGDGVGFDPETEQFADGPGSIARFYDPNAAVVVDSEQCVFIADSGNNRLRRMTLPKSLFDTTK